MTETELYEFIELKDQGFVHRDIKPLNVMLTRTGAKLLDFNIASRAGDPVHTRSGTPTDLFAVGVVLYQLLCDGQHPYPHAKPVVYETVIDPRKRFLIQVCAPDEIDRFPTAVEMQTTAPTSLTPTGPGTDP